MQCFCFNKLFLDIATPLISLHQKKGKVPIFVSQSNLVSIANRTIAHGMDLQRLTEAIYWIVKVLFLSSCQIKGHVFDVLQFLSEVFRRQRVCFWRSNISSIQGNVIVFKQIIFKKILLKPWFGLFFFSWKLKVMRVLEGSFRVSWHSLLKFNRVLRESFKKAFDGDTKQETNWMTSFILTDIWLEGCLIAWSTNSNLQ